MQNFTPIEQFCLSAHERQDIRNNDIDLLCDWIDEQKALAAQFPAPIDCEVDLEEDW